MLSSGVLNVIGGEEIKFYTNWLMGQNDTDDRTLFPCSPETLRTKLLWAMHLVARGPISDEDHVVDCEPKKPRVDKAVLGVEIKQGDEDEDDEAGDAKKEDKNADVD